MLTATPAFATPSSEEISRHLPLVRQVVAGFVRRLPVNVLRDDLVAAGILGLVDSLRKNGGDGGPTFESYARIRIRGAIVDELRRHDWSPRRRKEQGEGEGAMPRVAVVGFDDLPPQIGLVEEGVSPLEHVEEKYVFEALYHALDELPARERAILKMRYFEGMPSKAIATALGLSEARISQLHARATSRLREILAAGGDVMELAA